MFGQEEDSTCVIIICVPGTHTNMYVYNMWVCARVFTINRIKTHVWGRMKQNTCTFYQSYVCSRIVEYIKHREKKFKKSKKQNDHLFYIFLCDTNYLSTIYYICVQLCKSLYLHSYVCTLYTYLSSLSLKKSSYLFKLK